MNSDKSDSLGQQWQLDKAKDILDRMRTRWPVVEDVRGSGAGNPAVATLLIPTAEWVSLSKQEQISLTFYAENMVDDVRANPSKYLTDSQAALNYVSMLQACKGIRDGFWQIIVGRVKDEAQMTLMVDEAVVVGDALLESNENQCGVKASLFRASI